MAKVGMDAAAAVADLEAALLDANPSLRQFARSYLERLGRHDLAATYRAALVEGGRTTTALAGLGETGSNDDLTLVRPYLASESATERCAAVEAMGRLGGGAVAAEIQPLLADDHAKVAATAERSLERSQAILDGDQLMELLKHDPRAHVRRAATTLADQLGAWAGLPLLLTAAADKDDSVAARAKAKLHNRMIKMFATPTPAELENVSATLDDLSSRLEPGLLAEITAWLRGRRA
jgi:HEAT repeat protein